LIQFKEQIFEKPALVTGTSPEALSPTPTQANISDEPVASIASASAFTESAMVSVNPSLPEAPLSTEALRLHLPPRTSETDFQNYASHTEQHLIPRDFAQISEDQHTPGNDSNLTPRNFIDENHESEIKPALEEAVW
jgi:hypothetical protein